MQSLPKTVDSQSSEAATHASACCLSRHLSPLLPLLWRFDNNSYYLPVYLPCNNSLHRLTAAPRHARIDDDRNDEKESRRWRQPHVHSVLLQNALFCKTLHSSWDFLRIVGWGIGFLDVETSGGLGTLSQSISLWIAMDARQQSESEVP